MGKLLSLLAVPALLAGCANPGPPRPPSLYLPHPVTDLTAIRMGNAVKLQWTTPERTTDNLKVKPGMTAEICREIQPPDSACDPVLRLPVQPGPSTAVDPLHGSLATGPDRLIAYRIRIENARGRAARPSAAALSVAGAAPVAVTDLRVTPQRQGALLQWKAEAAGGWIEVDRRPLTQGTARPKTNPMQPREPDELQMKAGETMPTGMTDAGGTLDDSARAGETYVYTAQRVHEVELGGHTLEVRSAVSAPVTARMRDTFPPAVPRRLEAVPGRDAIDLSWEPDADPDLAGYVLYRQDEAEGGGFRRLTAQPIPEPGYHDATVVAGHTYRYRVTAVDTSGNESAPGAAIEQEMPTP